MSGAEAAAGEDEGTGEGGGGPDRVPASGTTRWRGTCTYDGSAFDGWQSQPGGRAVQDVLEAALASVLGGRVRVHGSARTDAGVHARGQVFHVDAAWRHGPEKLRAALRPALPLELRVVSVVEAEPGWHARYSARGKRYVYTVLEGEADPFNHRFVWPGRGRLDVEAMRRVVPELVGRRDFTTFGATSRDVLRPGDALKSLWSVEVRRGGRGEWRIVFEGSGFLYRMARRLAAALVAVGQGRLSVAELVALRDAAVPTAAIATAPAGGLCLERVYYRLPAVARRTGSPAGAGD